MMIKKSGDADVATKAATRPRKKDLASSPAFAGKDDPFSVLGPHETAPGVWEIRAMNPDAIKTWVEMEGETLPMQRINADGFFVAEAQSDRRPAYRFKFETGYGVEIRDDPYWFGPIYSADELARVADVRSDAAFQILGAHERRMEGIAGIAFAVWAPNARRIGVVGDFNAWDGRRHPMRLRHDVGVWELFIPALAIGSRYKFEIHGADGSLQLKADPIAFAAEQPPATASTIAKQLAHAWEDGDWLAKRDARDPRGAPMTIYECHLGSWRRANGPGAGRYLSYRELAETLIPYVVDMGFTHIELLPITEHPFDGSWGYQPVSLYAPTSRFGSPEDFATFVDAAHKAGIGLILDWVPGHFPLDAHGLSRFDGTHLYEHADPRQGFHQDWGTYIYNFGRPEVAAFLAANARFWIEHYHLDGLRVDAVASMLYLDYSRKPNEWVPNRHGGNENLDAIDFLRRVNETVYGARPGAVTIAEESTSWPGVSHPTYTGGLGFGFKWNMGWMHDTLLYMSHDPIHRRFHHNDLTFGLLYAFSENFVLPLSHDEVVHGKGSLLAKMPGDPWRKFANLRAYFGFMWGHPGKKLLFMGGEFAQDREWNHDQSLDWHLLDDPRHAGMKLLVRDLNRVYRETPALHEQDCLAAGFAWIVADDNDNSVLAFLRRGTSANSVALVVSNFTPVPRENYRVGAPLPGVYRELVNSDAAIYGGGNVGNGGGVTAEATPSHGFPYSLTLTLPPLATVILAL